MSTFLYSPGVRVIIETRTGTIEVTDDLTSGTLTLNENAPHSFSFGLMNQRRKYDGVFTPNDRIVVRMKRLRWLQTFAGYLDTVPHFSVYPRQITLAATCTLKRLANTLWDAGTIASSDFLNTMIESSPQGGDTFQKVAVEFLVQVANWPRDEIHLGMLPSDWATKIVTLQNELADTYSVPAILLGAGTVVAGVDPSQSGTVLHKEIGRGYGYLPAPNGKATYFGTEATGALNLSGEYTRSPFDPWYCAMRWPYEIGTRERGQKPYPDPSMSTTEYEFSRQWWGGEPGTNHGRRLLVTNPVTNRAVVLRAADWGPAEWTGGVIDMSQHALQDVLGIQGSGYVEIRFAPDGAALGPWTAQEFSPQPQTTQPVSTAQARQGATDGRFFPVAGASHYNNDPYPDGDWHAPRAGHLHQGVDITASKGTPLVAVENGLVQWSNTSAGGNGIWLAGDSGYFYYYAHCDTRVSALRDQRVTAGMTIGTVGATGDATGPHLHFEIHKGSRSSTAIQPGPILDQIRGGGTTVPDTGQAASDPSPLTFNTVFQADPESEILAGPRALMNDDPVGEFVRTILGASMRSFCSAPNGDFIAWFPDYFGIYGLAGKMIVRDIELMDFTIAWSDNNLKTHWFASGSWEALGEGAPGAEAATVDRRAETSGIASVEQPEILQALLQIDPADTASGGWFSPEAILQRFGARVGYTPMPAITSPLGEFWLALYKFQENWAKQFSTRAPITFMPEIFPGMLMQLPTYKIQFYVETVTHRFSFSEGGGFETEVGIVAPSATDGSGLFGLPRGHA